MIFFISLLLILLGFYFKKSKGLYVLQFSWMWIVLSLCNDYMRVDYQNYVRAYQNFGTYNFNIISSEWGYALINRWFYQLGFSFETANSIFVFVSLALFALSIPKYVKNYNIPASFFMLFPLLLNGIQIRNTLSAAIIVWGIQYLLSDNNIDVVKYILSVIVAMLFHATAFFYLIFILVKFFSLKKIQMLVAILMLFMLSIFRYISPLLSAFMGEDRFENKMISGTNSWIECIPAVIWALILLFTVSLMYIHFKKQVLDKQQKKFIDLMIKIDTLLLLLLPVMVIDYSFERLFRNVVILNYCLFVMYYENCQNKRTKEFYINVCCSLFYIFFCVLAFEIVFGNRLEAVVKVYLNNNLILSSAKDYILLFLIIIYIAGWGFIFDAKRIVWVKNRRKKLLIRFKSRR